RPPETTSCQCGVPHQTRTHILVECPLLEPYRHLLCPTSRSLSQPILLSTKTGLETLAKFV
ncbi:hypothetical protein M405DRAFT_700852, partial [Rhizopogon salebrosus TDB-379]